MGSQNTRICSLHWKGGQKLSRTYLPTLFPWTVPRNERRKLVRGEVSSSKRTKSTRNEVLTDEGHEGAALEFLIDNEPKEQRVICNFVFKGHCHKSDKVRLDDEKLAVCNKLKKFELEVDELKQELKQNSKVIDELKEKLKVGEQKIKSLEYQLSNSRFDIE